MNSKAPLLKAAWDRFHQSQESARQLLENTPRFEHPAHRAQGYHTLIEAQAMAYNWIVAPRLNHPRIFTHTAWASYLFTIAGNCPDFIYGILPLDGRGTYRLRGRHGDVRLLLVQVLNLPMGVEGSRCTGNYEFSPDDGDEIEIVLSATEQAGHWIPLDPASGFNLLILRRLMLDWGDDPGQLEVEALTPLAGYDELDEAATARRIAMAADFQLAVVRNWALGLFGFTQQLSGNRFNIWAPVPGEMMAAIAGSASCNYAFLLWNLQPDEALLIEFEPPQQSAYWSFQLVDVWSKSLDFMHEQTDFNMRNAAIDTDGKLRAVISCKDPGIINWLNPMGRPQGLCALRNYRSPQFTNPTVQLLKFTELERALPADTRRLDAEQRAASIARRRPAILGLYGG